MTPRIRLGSRQDPHRRTAACVAERHAARLERAGDKRAAEVIRALIRSHRAQRQALVQAHRERQSS